MKLKTINSAILITAITAFLYASSTAYTYGYYRVLDLDSNVLDRNFHQIIYHGMILNIQSALLVPFLLAFLVTGWSSYKIELDKFARKASNLRKIVKLKKMLHLSTRKKSKVVIEHERRIISSWVAAFFVLAIFSALVVFEKKGVRSAKDLLNNIENGDFNNVRLKGSLSENSLAYLFCGARNCAVYDRDSKEVIYFSQDEFAYLRRN